MPKLTVDCSQTYQTIIRPVALQVVDDMLKQTGIEKDIPVIFPGANSGPIQSGSALTNDEGIRFDNERHLKIEVTEQYLEEGIYNSSIRSRSQPFIFCDDTLAINIEPIYSETQLTFSVSFKAPTRHEVEQWRDRMRRKVIMGHGVMLHKVNYHYVIPQEYLVVLHHLHSLRETVSPYNESLKEYLKSRFHPRVGLVADLAGQSEVMVKNETQIGITGVFDWTLGPELNKGGNGENWEVSFTYTIMFDKISSISMTYPMMVHNQLVGDKFRLDCDHNAPLVNGLGSKTRYYLDHVRETLDYMDDAGNFPPFKHITLPCFDDWLPERVPLATSTALTAMIGVDTDNPTEVFDITNLGDYTFHPVLLDYILEYPEKVTQDKQHPVHVQLYIDEHWLDEVELTMDAQGKVTTQNPMDPRRRHHIRISLVNDLSLLSDQAITRLLDQGEVAKMLLIALAPDLFTLDNHPPIGSNGRMNRREFFEAIARIRTTNRQYSNGIEVSRLHVGIFTVTAH
ncbi:hypothetical protein [Endozoicomonas sp. ONNA1]|uniref:hypothetical protein n=1 Tax=Endozoicomonas sp. ONNA1 TaxID=2828740 RepID=UPI002147F45D|nr:hypothetical protein [Endozoicomonas sp. ONNA1]